MSIDYISDIHLDFYVSHKNGLNEKAKAKIRTMVLSLIPINSESKILVIAGDIGHYNEQNKYFLEYISEFYEDVVFCLGNHDKYLVSKKQINKYKNSHGRVREMVYFAKKFDNIHCLDVLDQTMVCIGEYVFVGGCGSWGEIADSTDNFNTRRKFTGLYEVAMMSYTQIMNDAKYIVNGYNDRYDDSPAMQDLTPLRDLKKFNHFIGDSVRFINNQTVKNIVFVSHYPIKFNVNPFDNVYDPYYYMIPNNKIFAFASNCVNIHGHVHKRTKFMSDNQYSNALGYPNEVYKFNGLIRNPVGVYDCDNVFESDSIIKTIKI